MAPLGGYHDGPVYLRIRKSLGLAWRADTGLPLSHADPEHVFVPADNSHSAFAYRAWLRATGLPDDALAVVRPAGRARDPRGVRRRSADLRLGGLGVPLCRAPTGLCNVSPRWPSRSPGGFA